jgi:hypothetical protein
MAKIKAKLRSMDLRGDTVSTQWGSVSFSEEGLAELEVDEVDLPLLRGLKWLHEPPTTSKAAPEPEPSGFDTPDSEESTELGGKKTKSRR